MSKDLRAWLDTGSKYSKILLLLLLGKINVISQTYIVQDYLHFVNSF